MDFVYALVRSGIEIDAAELAYLLLNDRNQGDYIHVAAGRPEEPRHDHSIATSATALPGSGNIPFADDPALRILCRDIEQVIVPEGLQPSAETARTLAKKAMVQRSQDFAASSNTYLLACRLQWDAVEMG